MAADNASGSVRWQSGEPIKRLPFSKFLPLLRAAVAADPNRADLKLELATALFHTDRLEEIVASFASAIEDQSSDPRLLYYLGRSALAGNKVEFAAMAFQSAAARGYKQALGWLAELLWQLGEPQQALEAALQALEHSPTDFKAMSMATRLLEARGEHERLWALCASLRSRSAWAGLIPSAMARASTSDRRDREVAELIDPSRWFVSTRLEIADDFNKRLEAELLEDPSGSALPSTKATIGAGTRIDQLQLVGGTAAQELLGNVRAAVEHYVASRRELSQHPMIAHQPRSVTLDSWAVAVQSDGHETWHIHPAGWISGVYYVKMPDVSLSESVHAGEIEFGPYPFGSQRDIPSWPRWHLAPQAGQLLLFPSYYAHRTWPTGVRQSRICVAFDVLPSLGSQVRG